jgi:hypothetical protein
VSALDNEQPSIRWRSYDGISNASGGAVIDRECWRGYFAGQALAGLLAAAAEKLSVGAIAENSWRMAQYMLVERDKAGWVPTAPPDLPAPISDDQAPNLARDLVTNFAPHMGEETAQRIARFAIRWADEHRSPGIGAALDAIRGLIDLAIVGTAGQSGPELDEAGEAIARAAALLEFKSPAVIEFLSARHQRRAVDPDLLAVLRRGAGLEAK